MVSQLFMDPASEDGRLAARFLRSLYTTIDRVAMFPRSEALLALGVRRTLLDTFPYWLYYRTLDQRLEVIGVLHTKRDPDLWERLEE